MKPRNKLAESKTPSGNAIGLYEQDGAYSINIGGQELMHSRANASECLLGSLGMARLKNQVASRVLIGGLGLGFTLSNVLKVAEPQSRVDVPPPPPPTGEAPALRSCAYAKVAET